MEFAVLVKDETSSGQVKHHFKLELVSDRLSVRELIQQRVRQEVEKFNKNSEQGFKGLIQPTDTEKFANGYFFKNKSKPKVDIEEQIKTALKAFKSNGFFLFVDDKQLTDLDENVFLKENSEVSFLKLIALVGG